MFNPDSTPSAQTAEVEVPFNPVPSQKLALSDQPVSEEVCDKVRITMPASMVMVLQVMR